MSSIEYIPSASLFFLQTATTSYCMMLHKGTYLMHLYWGPAIEACDISWYCEPPYRRYSRISEPDPSSDLYTSEFWPFEYPVYGSTDFRPPALKVEDRQGYRLSDLTYREHRIYEGKRSLMGLPSLGEERSDAHSLEIDLEDERMGIRVTLFYSVFDSCDVICRHSEITNLSPDEVTIHTALSASVDFKHGKFDMLHFSGTTLRERTPVRRPLGSGLTAIESSRGISSHVQNPATFYLRRETTESLGEAYGVNLLYSGNFSSSAHLDQYDSARVSIGINPSSFAWQLAPGRRFVTPEAILCHSQNGIEGLSHQFHSVLNSYLPDRLPRRSTRAIALNTWEACYFDVSHQRVVELAETAKELGIELLVLDDGWFGKRDDESSSLGDWKVNLNKFPHGIEGISQVVHQKGLQFGIWVEPEMVSPKSDLYSRHPDWVLHVPESRRSQWRYQLVLDLSRQEVCDHIIETVSSLLSSARIDYVKWDMNRRLTEVGNQLEGGIRQQEISHRYILGLYRILETLTSRFPEVCFENCASGGGRYDAGMLYYFPQAWPSDNTDPSSRLKILYGSSIAYPLSNFRSHVTSSPNHQLGRIRSLSFRQHVASCGILGYELDLGTLDTKERELVKAENAWYKRYRKVIQTGTFYRLLNPFESNKAAFSVVSQDAKTSILWFFRYQAEAEEAYFNVRLHGLDPGGRYLCQETGTSYSGSVLMHVGLTIPWVCHDDLSIRWSFVKQ